MSLPEQLLTYSQPRSGGSVKGGSEGSLRGVQSGVTPPRYEIIVMVAPMVTGPLLPAVSVMLRMYETLCYSL